MKTMLGKFVEVNVDFYPTRTTLNGFRCKRCGKIRNTLRSLQRHVKHIRRPR